MTRTLSRLWRSISHRAAPESAVVVIEPQTGDLVTQLNRLGVSWATARQTLTDAMTPAVRAAAAALGRLAEQLNPYFAANDPVHVAGLEGRYFVRAGLDPAYRDPVALNQLVWSILRGEVERATRPTPRAGRADLLWVNDENRSLIAAAAIRGWVGSYAGAETVRVLAWHRQMPDGQRLIVGRAS